MVPEKGRTRLRVEMKNVALIVGLADHTVKKPSIGKRQKAP